MTRRVGILLLVVGSVVAAGTGVAADATVENENEIYTCRDENGHIEFQNDPCPELPRRKAPPPKPASPKKKVRSAPAPEPLSGGDTIELRVGNGSWIIEPPPPDRPAARVRRFGRQSFPTRHEVGGTVATPGFANPAQTWRTFLAALHADDAAAVVACLTPEAVDRSESLEALRRMVTTFDRIEDEGDVGPFWAIRGVRQGRPPKWILFEEVVTGEWKISGI